MMETQTDVIMTVVVEDMKDVRDGLTTLPATLLEI